MRMGSLITTETVPAQLLAGVDEAGRGCLAGPVVAGAVILPESYDLPGLTDSKKLKAPEREALYDAIREQALFWAVGVIRAPEIDRINILQATFRAMSKALGQLGTHPRLVQVDGNHIIPKHVLPFEVAQEAVVKGDGTIPAISAASIMAKTFRDLIMMRFAPRFPAYQFEKHMGYGTKVHLEALQEHGPCRLHRLSFKGVLPEKQKQRQAGLPL